MGRGSREQIRERRERVWEMVVRGVSQREIAQALGVHQNTIHGDVQELRKEHRSGVKDTDVHDEIGDIVAKYDEIFRYAMVDYSTVEKPSQKAQFLDKAMSALSKKVTLLVETGILPRAVQEITGKLVIQGVDVTKASIEELKTLRERMLTQAGSNTSNRVTDFLRKN